MADTNRPPDNRPPEVKKSDAEWRAKLSAQQYHITREDGTERAFTGPYWDEKRPGLYRCICCDAPLFDAATKYDSGTGWPSFYAPAEAATLNKFEDRRLLFRPRTEVRCATCDAHLGHVFPDGPEPTGQRFCINGHALNFEAQAQGDASE